MHSVTHHPEANEGGRSAASLIRPFKHQTGVLRASKFNAHVDTPAAVDTAHTPPEDAHDHPHADPHPHHDWLHWEHRPHRNLFSMVQKKLHLSHRDLAASPNGSIYTRPETLSSEQAAEIRRNSLSEDSSKLPRVDQNQHKRSKIVDVFFKLKEDLQKLTKRKSHVAPPEPSPSLMASAHSSTPNAIELTPVQSLVSQNPLTPAESQNRRLSLNSMNYMTAEREEMDLAEQESYEKLKEYKFIKILGAGAQGTVSLRLHTPTSSLRALKSIPTAASMVDCHVRESFRREVEILQTCRQHPNVIRLLDAWESMHTVYQVFDVMNGGDASMEGVFNGIGEDKGIRLIAPIADALKYLHRFQILHRDVRPANIFLRRSITGHETLRELETIPVLADFGIANYTRNSGRLAAPFPETPAHIAPEILDGARFTTMSDCYGLGYYAMHLLLHRQPHLEDVRNLDDIPDVTWSFMTEEGKKAVALLLFPDPMLRMTAAEFCVSDWVVKMGVDCVRHST
ncbi:kinase-like domain-containing protein [Obelidium mucronatum]|nr:kinase-like domain-containing protein [Obelidium mucronatum]